jgi:hypothetical protein
MESKSTAFSFSAALLKHRADAGGRLGLRDAEVLGEIRVRIV